MDNNYLSEEQYNYEVHENYFLGSQGKRTGLTYAGLDDVTVITPKYDTNYKYNIPVKNIEKQGTYEEALLFDDYFGNDYYNDDPTRVYTGDNYSLSIIKNELAKNDTKILLVRDSFSRVISPFLASTCKELHIILWLVQNFMNLISKLLD